MFLAIFSVTRLRRGIISLCCFAEYRTSDSPSLSSASVLFTDISDAAVSLRCDLSSVWMNADKMTQCKYEV